MAISRAEAYPGLSVRVPLKESAAQKPLKLTPTQISNLMITTPPGLNEDHPIRTLAGTWHMEEGISIFDAKSTSEIEAITVPERSDRIKAKIRNFLQMD